MPLNLPNIAYVLHFYACTHGQALRDKLNAARQQGSAVFVSEFGSTAASGNGPLCLPETNAWLDYLDQEKISWVNWSLSNANESSAALRSAAAVEGGWQSSDLTESGQWLRNRLLTARRSEGWGPEPSAQSELSCQGKPADQSNGCVMR